VIAFNLPSSVERPRLSSLWPRSWIEENPIKEFAGFKEILYLAKVAMTAWRRSKVFDAMTMSSI
jgi:hypothetical protein